MPPFELIQERYSHLRVFSSHNGTRGWMKHILATGLHKQLHSFECEMYDEDSVQLLLSVDWPQLRRLGFDSRGLWSPLKPFYEQARPPKIFPLDTFVI